MKKLEWYAFIVRNGEVTKFNVFDSLNMLRGIKEIKKSKLTGEEFKKSLHGWLFYSFRSKCEYEILIGDLFGGHTEKFDVYNQVMLNFDAFCNYVASNI